MPPLGYESYETVPRLLPELHSDLDNETVFRLGYIWRAQHDLFPETVREKIIKVYYSEPEHEGKGISAWVQRYEKTDDIALYTQRVVMPDASSGQWRVSGKPKLRLVTDGLTLHYFDFNEHVLMLSDTDRLRYLADIGQTLDLLEQKLQTR